MAKLNKTKVVVEGEPEEVFEGKPKDTRPVSKPDRTSRFAVPTAAFVAGEFTDLSGNHWTLDKKGSESIVIDPAAVRKDGGDPGIFGIKRSEESSKHLVTGAQSPANESTSGSRAVTRDGEYTGDFPEAPEPPTSEPLPDTPTRGGSRSGGEGVDSRKKKAKK